MAGDLGFQAFVLRRLVLDTLADVAAPLSGLWVDGSRNVEIALITLATAKQASFGLIGRTTHPQGGFSECLLREFQNIVRGNFFLGRFFG